MSAKRIGILTGGGDVPGLNSVIKSVVYRASEIGCEVLGIRRGWEGLTHVNLNDPASRDRYILPLNRENTRTIAWLTIPLAVIARGARIFTLRGPIPPRCKTCRPRSRGSGFRVRNQPRRA